ncbi:MAG TPA: hypothetical protein ENK18_02485 [Deltaproteobacteria bacterium]|nr:hypothetical protein [Deltaproteobacteria bacterium]
MLHTRGSERGAEEERTTLVLATLVPVGFGAAIHNVVLRGRGSIEGLDREVSRTLEGFRVRASLEAIEGVAHAVDAGVLQPKEGEAFFGQAPVPSHGLVWISTAWIPGCTLRQAWPDMSVDQRHRALQGVVGALASLHRHDVLHGDLKPENVIVTPDRRIVLIDLETLREVGDTHAPIPCKEFTPGYGAPEQEGHHQSYLASDLWSFGALAASLLLEREPGEAIGALRRGESLPAPWGEVVRACLQPTPSARPVAGSVIALLKGRAQLSGRAEGATTIRVRDPAPRRRDPAQTLPERLPSAASVSDTLVPMALDELEQEPQVAPPAGEGALEIRPGEGALEIRPGEGRISSAGGDEGAGSKPSGSLSGDHRRRGSSDRRRGRSGRGREVQVGRPRKIRTRRASTRSKDRSARGAPTPAPGGVRSAIRTGIQLLPLVMGGLLGAVLAGFVTIVAMVDFIVGFTPQQEMVLFVWGPTAGFFVGALAAFALQGSKARILSFLALVVVPASIGTVLDHALVLDRTFHSQEVRVIFEITLFVAPALGLGWLLLERMAHYVLRIGRWLTARRSSAHA